MIMIECLDYINLGIMLTVSCYEVECESLVFLTMIWLLCVDLKNKGLLWSDIFMQYKMSLWYDMQRVSLIWPILLYDY